MRTILAGVCGLSLLLLAGCGGGTSGEFRALSYESGGASKYLIIKPGDPIPPVPVGATMVSLDSNWLTEDGIAQDPNHMLRLERGLITKIRERVMTYKNAGGQQVVLILEPGAAFPNPPAGATHVRRDGVLDESTLNNAALEKWKAAEKARLAAEAQAVPPAPAGTAQLPSKKEQVMTYVDAAGQTIRIAVPAGAQFPPPPPGATYVTRNGMMDPGSLPTQEQLDREHRRFLAAQMAKDGKPLPDIEAAARAKAGLTQQQWDALDEKGKQALERAAAPDLPPVRLSMSGRVGLKMIMTPEPDLGPPVKLNVPRKRSDKIGAFLHKQYVEQHVKRIEGEPRERDQKALDMMALYLSQSHPTPSEVCQMWKSVPWRAPLADLMYERQESAACMSLQMFAALGLRFGWNAEQLEKGGYSPYVVGLAHLSHANEILTIHEKEPVRRAEAQRAVEKAAALFPAMVEDASMPVELISLLVNENFVPVYTKLEKDPGPSTEKLLAVLAAKRPEALPQTKGEFLVSHAWHARGNGYASTVTEEAWALFSARLKEARKQLTMAWSREQNERIPTRMLGVCMGESDDAGHELWYNRAINLNPDAWEARNARLQYLCQKWGGSHEKMFAFARECVQRYRNDPAADPQNVFLIAVAHEEFAAMTPDAGAYLARKDVYQEIKQATELVLARRPKAMEAWAQLMYYADKADDFQTVLRAYAAQAQANFISSRRFRDVYFVEKARERAEQVLGGKGKP